MGRLLHQLSPTEKQSVLHLCICCRGKRKSILNVFNVCLNNGKKTSHSFTGIGYQFTYLLKKFYFPVLYSSSAVY